MVLLAKYVSAPVVRWGGACLILYGVGVVVLIHTPPLGFVSVGLTVMPQGPAVEVYARPFVGEKTAVATYPGPLPQNQGWNAGSFCRVKDPPPFPNGESIWR